jgi:hypothetical protein
MANINNTSEGGAMFVLAPSLSAFGESPLHPTDLMSASVQNGQITILCAKTKPPQQGLVCVAAMGSQHTTVGSLQVI